jgi:hypothetical protein
MLPPDVVPCEIRHGLSASEDVTLVGRICKCEKLENGIWRFSGYPGRDWTVDLHGSDAMKSGSRGMSADSGRRRRGRGWNRQ